MSTGVAKIAERRSKSKRTIKTPTTGVIADKIINARKKNNRDIP